MLLGRIETLGRRAPGGPRPLPGCRRSARGDVPSLASRLRRARRPVTAIVSGDVDGALVHARRALDARAPERRRGDDAGDGGARLPREPGRRSAASVRLEPIVELADRSSTATTPTSSVCSGSSGMCLTEAERFDEAERFLVPVVRRARRVGLVGERGAERRDPRRDPLADRELARGRAPRHQRRRGRRHDAREPGLGAGVPRPPRRRCRSRAELCRQRSAEALESGESTGARCLLDLGRATPWGCSRSASAGGPRPPRHLDRVAALTEALGRRLPGAVWWQGDHIEALVRAGRRRRRGRRPRPPRARGCRRCAVVAGVRRGAGSSAGQPPTSTWRSPSSIDPSSSPSRSRRRSRPPAPSSSAASGCCEAGRARRGDRGPPRRAGEVRTSGCRRVRAIGPRGCWEPGPDRSDDGAWPTCSPRPSSGSPSLWPRGRHQPGGRGGAVRQREDGRVPPPEHLPEAGAALEDRARRCGSARPSSPERRRHETTTLTSFGGRAMTLRGSAPSRKPWTFSEAERQRDGRRPR